MSRSHKSNFNSNKLNSWLLFISIIILLAALITKDYNRYSFNNILNYYGFNSTEQKYALKDLFERAGEKTFYESWNQFFLKNATKDKAARSILNMVRASQNKFSPDRDHKERWELETLEWMTKDKDAIIEDLTILGFVEAIKPWRRNVDAVCIMGASKKAIVKRIEYAFSLIKSGLITSNIIFLTGERYLSVGVDGTEKELYELAKHFNLEDWTTLTESDLIRKLYLESDLYKLNINTTILDTPKREMHRPNTQTSILTLITWLKEKNLIKNIIFVTNQPYVRYTSAVIDAVLREKKFTINYEVVGDEAISENNIKSISEALGSYIWAITPMVLNNMNIKIQEPDLTKYFLDLYYKNSITIYETVINNIVKPHNVN